MKLLILDDFRTRRNELTDALKKQRVDATACFSSNEFMTALEKQKFDRVLIDLESWNRGKAIYNQFGIAKRLENHAILFYNAATNFSLLNDRPRHQNDHILFKPTEVEAIVTSALENL